MIKDLTHILPGKKYVKVYYTDNYSILKKRFSDMEYARQFIDMLKKNSDFHLVEVRIVIEEEIKK